MSPLACGDESHTVRASALERREVCLASETAPACVVSGSADAGLLPPRTEAGASAHGAASTGSGAAGADASPAAGSTDPVSTGGKGAGNAGAEGAQSGEPSCWSLPVVDTVRVLPGAGSTQAWIGGRIEGSNRSATTGFETLARIEQGPQAQAPDGQAWLEISLPKQQAYRYVKYHAAAGEVPAVAELRLLSEGELLEGESFGTAQDHPLAFDEDPNTSFNGTTLGDNYVGLDLASEHVTSRPRFRPEPSALGDESSVEIVAPEAAEVLFTLDGSDPRAGSAYAGPIELPAGTTVVQALAVAECRLASPVVSASFVVGDPGSANDSEPARSGPVVQSSMHIGNSLTDTLLDYFAEVSQRGDVTLDFHRYTIPGAGLWLYPDHPTGGNGAENVQEELLTLGFDHVVVQPYPNLPCQPAPSEDGDENDGDLASRIWADARVSNPEAQLWIYQQWPSPVDFTNCFTGGEWTRAGWSVPSAPQTWREAVANELLYHRAVVEEVQRLNPELPAPRIVPVGQALVALLDAVEGGEVPGVTDYWGWVFLNGGNDVHLTPAGSYFVSEIFYSRLFERDPRGKSVDPQVGLSTEQAQALQSIAWSTAQSFASE